MKGLLKIVGSEQADRSRSFSTRHLGINQNNMLVSTEQFKQFQATHRAGVEIEPFVTQDDLQIKNKPDGQSIIRQSIAPEAQDKDFTLRHYERYCRQGP